MPYLRDRVAKSIEKLRNERLLTQAELAAEIDVGVQTVLRWENGRTWPSPEQLEALAAFFGVDPEKFFRAEDKSPSKPEKKPDPKVREALGVVARALGFRIIGR